MNKAFIVIGGSFCLLMASCKKYLDAKPGNDITIPATVDDCQRLLDNSVTMNRWMYLDGEASSDNISLTQTQYDAWGENYLSHLYWWGDDMYFTMETNNLWVNAYAAVEVANVVLKTISDVPRVSGDQSSFDNVKGSALFYRGYCFEKLLALYAKGYNSATKKNDLGIAIRLTEDFNVPSVRSNVSDSYDQVLKDFLAAAQLLPEKPLVQTRPSRQAAYGALAEVYLVMHDYENAKKYSDSCLAIRSDLLDYNDFDTTAVFPFYMDENREVIFLSGGYGSLAIFGNYSIDSTLYRSYEDTDLRKQLFFTTNEDGSTVGFTGRYFPTFGYFNGISVDEIYLIRAECEARLGDVSSSIDDLNTLLQKRYLKGRFTPYNVIDPKAALNLVLSERRKELVIRDFRWGDIKRLNIEGANMSITHYVNGKTYVLVPNDNKFAVALPYRDVRISGMQQNPR